MLLTTGVSCCGACHLQDHEGAPDLDPHYTAQYAQGFMETLMHIRASQVSPLVASCSMMTASCSKLTKDMADAIHCAIICWPLID